MGRIAFLALFIIALPGCWPDDAPKMLSVSGETMGTTYNVTTVGGPDALDARASRAPTASRTARARPTARCRPTQTLPLRCATSVRPS